MKIRLEQVGPYTCLPLPEQASGSAGFAPGDHVEVVWDGSRGQLVARAIAPEGGTVRMHPATDAVPHALEEFLAQYADAMEELAGIMSATTLTASDLGHIHARIVKATGGPADVRSPDALTIITTRLRISSSGSELYQDVYARAARLFRAILEEKPFLEANRRTAIAASAVYLRLNGQDLLATDHEVVDFCLSADRGSMDEAAVRHWFRIHSAPAA